MLFLHALLEIRAAPCKGMGSARPLEHQGCCRGDATSVATSWHVTSAWPPSRGGLLHLGHPNKLAQQGRARSPELGAALNPVRVWERGTGKGEEKEKGARSQQNIILGYVLSPWQLLGNLTGSELPSTK